jgi:hypothetical protein
VSDTAIRCNLITFTPYGPDGEPQSSDGRVTIVLSGSWKMSCGVHPNTNVAKISYKEFAKLDPASGPGTIEFWYSSPPDELTPDVTIESVYLIAVDPTSFGQPDGETDVQPVEYDLYFADARYLFNEPRGGRLMYGLLNAGPKVASGAMTQNVPANAPIEFSMVELIRECLDKMGIDPSLPIGVFNMDAPRDVRWMGNHAPTELERLLELSGCVLVPNCEDGTYDGTFYVDNIRSDGPDPDFQTDARLPDITLHNTDIRATSIVYSSFPNQSLTTETTGYTTGVADDKWEFVIQDASKNWTAIADSTIFSADGGYALSMRKRFAGVDAALRGSVTRQIFRYIRLKSSAYDPRISPIQNRLYDGDGDHDILVQSMIAQTDPVTQQWTNATGQVEVKVLAVLAGNILYLGSQLVTVKNPTSDVFADFQGTAPFTVRYSVSQANADAPGGDKRPVYYHAGFTREAGKTVALDDETIQAAIDGEAENDIRIYSRPELRLINVDGEDLNSEDLAASAMAEADRYFIGVETPAKLIQARGFAAIPLSGLVSEVEWEQESLLTRARVNDWYTAHRARSTDFLNESASSSAGAFPSQAGTGPSAVAMGQPGTTPAVVQVAHLAPEPSQGGNAVVLEIAANSTRPGTYAVGEVSAEAPASSGSAGFTAGDLWAPGGKVGVGFNQAEASDFGTAVVGTGGVGWIMPLGAVVHGTFVGLDPDGIRIYQFWAIAPINCGDVT